MNKMPLPKNEVHEIFIEAGFEQGSILGGFMKLGMGAMYDLDEAPIEEMLRFKEIWANRAMVLFQYHELGFTPKQVWAIEKEDWEICLDGGWEDILSMVKCLIETGAMIPRNKDVIDEHFLRVPVEDNSSIYIGQDGMFQLIKEV